MNEATLHQHRHSKYSHAWRALRHRNFKLFFFGQGLSLIGTWMTRLATTWLVYRMTESALMLGIVSFSGQIVTFAVAPFAGVWVERLDRRRLLINTQITAAIQSLTLAVLTLTETITLWEVIVLSIVQGIINAFDMPARQSFISQMVDDRRDLGNAIAINSSLANGARLIGPAIAGLVIAAVGEGGCFLIDGISYIAVIASLLLMRITPPLTPKSKAGMIEQIREGWNYVSTFRPIRTLLMLLGVLCLVGVPYATLLPIFAAQILDGGADTLGWLTAASGVGALCSGLSLTFRKSVVGLTRMLQLAAFLFGGGLVLFSLSSTLWLSLITMLFAGFGMMQCLAATNTIIQTLVPEDKRGRVMGYFMMAVFGTAPIGSLMAGMLAHSIGAPGTVLLAGVICLAAAFWFSVELPNIHVIMNPIYEKMGFLEPEPDIPRPLP